MSQIDPAVFRAMGDLEQAESELLEAAVAWHVSKETDEANEARLRLSDRAIKYGTARKILVNVMDTLGEGTT